MLTALSFSRFRFSLCLLSFVSLADAMPGALPTGSNLVTKGGYTGFFNPSFAHNPAMLPVALGANSYLLGGVHLPALAIEIGEVDNFDSRLDALETAVDEAESSSSEEGEDVSSAEAAAIKSEFDSFVAELGEDAYVGVDVNLPLPILPVMFKAFGGVMAVNAEASLGARINAFGDELEYDNVNKELKTNTAVYVQSGEFVRLGVSYGREIRSVNIGGKAFDMNVGGQLSITRASLSRQIISLDDDNDDGEESAFDRAEENYDKNTEETTALGLDIGVAFMNGSNHFGATLRNIIPQEFDFSDLGVDCASKIDPAEKSDCESAKAQIDKGRVSAKQSYEIEPQLMLEGSYLIPESRVRVFGSAEVNSVENVAGAEYQWASVGIGYAGPWWLPGVEIAYHSNLAGEKLGMMALGVQLFKAINLQVSVSPEKAKYDGDSVYRAAAFSLSFATSL